jgi:hypothetical protein
LLQRAYPHLKIVLLSVDAGDAAAAKEAGADFIYKGAAPDELIATLTFLLHSDSLPHPNSCKEDETRTKHSNTDSIMEGT